MIYLKSFEFGKFKVLLVPKRYSFSVRCVGYKSVRYKGYIQYFDKDSSYSIFDGSLAQANDIFNQEVSYLCRMEDENIYYIFEALKRQDEVIF